MQKRCFLAKTMLRQICFMPLVFGSVSGWSQPCLAKNVTRKIKPRPVAAQFQGPYTLSVQEEFSEMLIKNQLVNYGIAHAADPTVRLDEVMNALPAILPAEGYISSGFGYRPSPFNGRRLHHNGVDFAVAYGSPVRATADGLVTTAGWQKFLGKAVAIDHGMGIATQYGHNSKLLVHVGDHVRRGDIIALAGSTGRSTGSHVHYEVWLNHQRIDPSQFLFHVPDRHLYHSTLVAERSPVKKLAAVTNQNAERRRSGKFRWPNRPRETTL